MENEENEEDKDETIDEGVTRDVEYLMKCIDRIEEEYFCSAEVFENFEWDQD